MPSNSAFVASIWHIRDMAYASSSLRSKRSVYAPTTIVTTISAAAGTRDVGTELVMRRVYSARRVSLYGPQVAVQHGALALTVARRFVAGIAA